MSIVTKWLTCVVVGCALVACYAGGQVQKASSEPSTPLPLFNQYVVKVMESYPRDGTHQYYWPRNDPKMKGWKGATQDVVYLGETVMGGDSEGRCYCCGLTYEVFLRAALEFLNAQGHEQIKDWTPGEVNKVCRQWFGATGDRRLVQNAIVKNDIGIAVGELEKVQRGDFVQFWRTSGSGHSVIFDRWLCGPQGQITGFRYWSTQKSTNGLNYNEEFFAGEGREKGVKKEEFYAGRVLAAKLLPAEKPAVE